MTITGFEDVEEMLNKLANPCEMAEKACLLYTSDAADE